MDLRKKHPIFRYINYEYIFKEGDLNISFNFLIEPNISLKPKLKIKNVSDKNVSKDVLENLIFNLGMIELVSYYKATCSPKIIIECGKLNLKQKNFWKKIYLKGLGEFFFQNKINFTNKNFLEIECNSNKTFKKKKIKAEEKILLPIGGGKDSIVSLNLLKDENIYCLGLNKTKEIENTIGKNKHIYVERKIDDKLLELNRKGYYNGHTPFSAYLAFLSLIVAYIINARYIVLSNERSSNEETTVYLNKKINHQYSKTFEFENDFRKYSKEFILEGIEYFSFLRPLYEIQIAKIFSKFKKYHTIFLSCNEANKTYSGTKEKTFKWCGSCPKCLFVFAILYPFIKEEELLKIFNKNLFEDKNLKDEMLKLIGFKKNKPFECIGTKKESLLAFYLSFKKAKDKNYYLLNYLNKNNYFKNIKEKEILYDFNEKNNLPQKFKKILKNEITRS
ncbi:MAG TPA: hypothetical protein PKU93_00835 [Candidatus Pacearchaeota archaeon]|nr:hypothetical protein [Candidatus Pacearchaeota archaeon]